MEGITNGRGSVGTARRTGSGYSAHPLDSVYVCDSGSACGIGCGDGVYSDWLSDDESAHHTITVRAQTTP